MTELKPCPCCGPKAFITPSTKCEPSAGKHFWTAELRCHECGLNISRSAATEKEALDQVIESWNTRAEREVGISKFQKLTGTNYVTAKRTISALKQVGLKVVE